MKRFAPITYFREHFTARIFLIFACTIIAISFAFTGFFFHYQSKALTERTVSKGELLATLLAQTVRLGVFAENTDLLNTEASGILGNQGVRAVAIYNVEGKVLACQRLPGSAPSSGDEKWDGATGEAVKKSANPLLVRKGNNFAFLSRVVLEAPAAGEDEMYFGARPRGENVQPIGFVRVELDGRILRKDLDALLLVSLLIGVASLFFGSIVAYFIARKITKPLNRLTAGVNAFGAGGRYERIDAASADEIGKLAAAFNNMVDSLEKREAEKDVLEEQLRQAQKMEAVGTLAGGVAHDFNNILTAIIGYGSMLKNTLPVEEKLWSYADQVVRAGERAATLTQRLLAFSRKQTNNPVSLDLNDVVRNMEKMLTRLISENIEMQCQFAEEHAVVRADAGQMDQVLMNLVTNARDAMPQGGVLTITTGVAMLADDFAKRHELEKSGEYVVMSVNDNGVGMNEKIRERIFDPFFTTKEVGKGTGLGLSTVYGIVKQHGGGIELDSEPGRGTSIRIYLPRVEPVVEITDTMVPVQYRGNGESILVAEDDMSVMSFIKKVLEMNGYRVVEAPNGVDAILRFSAAPSDISLALLDVIMPGKNGREVYEEITRIRPGMKVLFMSGYTDEVIDGAMTVNGEINLIFKPLRPEELLKRVKESLLG
jgi:hypothetical protein